MIQHIVKILLLVLSFIVGAIIVLQNQFSSKVFTLSKDPEKLEELCTFLDNNIVQLLVSSDHRIGNFNLFIAKKYFARKDWVNAYKYGLFALKEIPHSSELLVLLVKLEVRYKKNKNKSKKYLDQLLKTQPNYYKNKLLEVELALINEEYKEAAKILDNCYHYWIKYKWLLLKLFVMHQLPEDSPFIISNKKDNGHLDFYNQYLNEDIISGNKTRNVTYQILNKFEANTVMNYCPNQALKRLSKLYAPRIKNYLNNKPFDKGIYKEIIVFNINNHYSKLRKRYSKNAKNSEQCSNENQSSYPDIEDLNLPLLNLSFASNL